MMQTTRRTVLRGVGALAASTALGAPFIRKAEAATLSLRWLGWEHYNVAGIVSEFEKEYGVKMQPSFFDGNSEAYNKLKAGGTTDFDIVMSDGFWPRLYAEQGLTQAVDYGQIPSMEFVFDDFKAPNYQLLQAEGGTDMIAAPNCWGGYGITINADKIDAEDADSLTMLFNEKYKGHISTSARFEENIALAGILAAHNLGTTDGPRPDGGAFNPYNLTDAELEEAKQLLIKQKRLLLTRWNDEDTLERLLRSQTLWASPEWSGIYRRIHFEALDGTSKLNMRHILRPKEGGLGWVDTWAITSGVTDSETLEMCHKWIDWRLKPENMAIIATEVGWAPTVDVRSLIPERYVETMFLNNTGAIRDLYQFDAPSSPEKWERVWSEVEAA